MAKSRNRNQKYVLKICTLALLCAMQIVLARVFAISIGTSIRFSFSFIAVVIAAKHYGILGGVIVYGVGDFIGAISSPTNGPYNPCFTVTSVIAGFIFGVFLGKELEKFWMKLFSFDKRNIIRIILSVVSSQVICSLLLNSFWLSQFYGAPFWAKITERIPQVLIIGTLEIIFMVLFLDKISNALKKAGV